MEIVVAVSILSILAATLALRAGGMLEKGRTGKIVQLVSTLKTACAAYNADTGTYAYEYSGYAGTHRKLSANQTAASWDGPYLEGPLTHQQNPFASGSLHLYNTVTANGWLTGFDVDGDGTEDVTSDGNMLWLSNVPADAAQRIDQAIDAGIGGTWSTTGRVRYSSSSKHLYVLVYY
ncbi:MAG: hypothetical protein H6828_00470 [Planctomycetes bacterium]|nr:hypothetical protein [Planctomycetota bacterium]